MALSQAGRGARSQYHTTVVGGMPAAYVGSVRRGAGGGGLESTLCVAAILTHGDTAGHQPDGERLTGFHGPKVGLCERDQLGLSL